MVNYDPVLKTVLSDQEVIYKEEINKIYFREIFLFFVSIIK